MKPNDKKIEEKTSNTWEDEFDEKFTAIVSYEKYHDELSQLLPQPVYMWNDEARGNPKFVKSFIRQLLEQKEREIVEKIEKTRKRTFTYMATPTIGADFTNVGGKKITAGKSYKATSSLSEEEIIYNQALDDIIKLIKTT